MAAATARPTPHQEDSGRVCVMNARTVADNVGGESERAEAVPGGPPFGFLDASRRPAPLLNQQTPEQDAAGNQFDDAIDAKALQRNATTSKANA